MTGYGQAPLFHDGDTPLVRAWREFHEANPHVYELFARFAMQAVRAGRTQFSARTIWHRMRWHADVETTSADTYKLNDHHSPYYAREFMRRHPEHEGFFRKRRVQGDSM